jgi:LPS-assembly lipoprotein
MKKLIGSALILAISMLATACGFQPIYATPAGTSPVIRQVAVQMVAAPESIAPEIRTALDTRLAPGEGVAPRYDLFVDVKEVAEQLAVQIDATVTRYNYRLYGNYTLVDRNTGDTFRGPISAVTSYNIVSSQYSTLFAEKTALKKAARLLAENIERDILIRFAEGPDESPGLGPTQLDGSVILVEPRRGEVVKPADEVE